MLSIDFHSNVFIHQSVHNMNSEKPVDLGFFSVPFDGNAYSKNLYNFASNGMELILD